jgi:putative transposase
VKKDLTLKDRIYKCQECGIEMDRDFNAIINIDKQLPIVHRKVTPVKITAMDLGATLVNLTSIVEAGNKHQINLVMSRFE